MKKLILAGSAAAALLIMALWFFGRPAYKQHKEATFIERARAFKTKGDPRNASISARQALAVNPNNLEACLILADLADGAHSPHVLDWRKRIAELEPTTENKLLLASAALRAQPPPCPLAAQTLKEMEPAASGNAAYHSLSAELALKCNKPAEAASHFEQAARLEPGNEVHQLNLAVLRLESSDPVAVSNAQVTLENLSTNTNRRPVALRWLAAASLKKNDLATAKNYSVQLISDPRAVMDDRLQHLTILHAAKDADLDSALHAVQSDATKTARDMYATTEWMVASGMAEAAIHWVINCPANVRAQQPVPLAMVDCYVAKKDWRGLENFLQDQKKWDDLEFLRLAFLSRAAAEQRESLAAEARWKAAVREAGERLGSLNALLNLATVWHRDKAREDLLWLIGQRFPRERWVYDDLKRLYVQDANTRGLFKLYSALASFDPQNIEAKNNLAATSMLLKLNLTTAHQLAKEAHLERPNDAIAASTYAYSLHLQGRTKEAITTLEQLKPEALENPPIALYYGFLLSAAGQTNKAGKYLELARTATVLPEETNLLAQASKTF